MESEISASWHETISQHCERFLGPSSERVWEEIGATDVTIGIHPHLPTEQRPWQTLRTCGISHIPTNPPAECRELTRLELLTYVPPDWPTSGQQAPVLEPEGHWWWWPAEMLKLIGRYVHVDHTWLGPWHTVDLTGGTGEPISGTMFVSALLFPPGIEPDDFGVLEVDGMPVSFLWVIPITAAELDLKRDRAGDELISLMNTREQPHVIDPQRACMVTGATPPVTFER